MLQRTSSLLGSRIAVLMYHRVYETSVDPWGTCVSPANFDQQMEYLSRRHTVLSVSRLVGLLAAGRLPKRAVALTFDDGYRDNLSTAKPVLERWDLPATFFVPTGLMEGSREFWWDELSRVLLEPGSLPRTFDIGLGTEADGWELGDSAVYTAEDRRRHEAWTVHQRHDPTPRHALLRSLNDHVYLLPQGDKQRVLDRLFEWSGVSSDGRRSHRTLTGDELLEVERGGLVDVGGHSVTHPVLSALPLEAQREEITKNKAELEDILGHPVSSFAYPHGAYGRETAALVRNAGFASAVTVENGPLRAGTDPFELPRVHSGDWNGDEFGRRLEEKLLFH